jgi:hypothetical protein
MHDVPRTFLKHFSSATTKANNVEYTIFSAPASNPAEALIRSTNIRNVCLENDLYTLPGTTPEERMFLEKMYNELYERKYEDLYNLLTDEKQEQLSPTQRHDIISLVVSMFFRNRSWGNTYNKLMDETYAKVFALKEDGGKESFFMDDKEISIAGKTLEEFQRESRKQDRPMIALTGAQKIFELVRIREVNDIVTIVKLEDTPLEFIVSDNPVTIQDSVQQRPIPFDPANTLSIPIDSKHLLQLRPWANQHQLEKDKIWRTGARGVIALATSLINNRYQAAQATRFILGTESGLKTFIQTKDRYNN